MLYPFHRQVIVFLAAIVLVSWAEALPDKAIQRINEVRMMSPEEADNAHAVDVHGQILWKNQFNHNFFLYNNGNGVFVRSPKQGDLSVLQQLKVGDLIDVTGVTDRGGFTPRILGRTFEFKDHAPLPEAPPLNASLIFATNNDCKWYQVTGRVVDMHIYDDDPRGGSIVLLMDIGNVPVNVIFPRSDVGIEKARELMFSYVRFNAVAGTQSNIHRQFVGRLLFANSLDDCEVIHLNRPVANLEKSSIHELGRSGQNLRGLVETYGWVTHVSGRQIYLSGEEAALKATVRGDVKVAVGDYVELTGLVVPGRVNSSFLASDVTKVEAQAPREPVRIDIDDTQLTRWSKEEDVSLNYEFVEITADLVEFSETESSTDGETVYAMICRNRDTVFSVNLPFDPNVIQDLEPGAKLRIRGICHLIRNDASTWRLSIASFFIEPRSVEDLEVIKPAPWWTVTRMLWLLGGLLTVSVLSILWSMLLHRTVERQTSIIAEKVERESVLDERQRIAQELHDTLEQGLAGLGMLLSICKGQIFGGSEQAKETIVKSIGAYRSCSEQSRSAIVELRESDGQSGLVSRLSEFVDETILLGDGDIRLEVAGTDRALPRLVSHYLYRICVEAANNAKKHAQPHEILINLLYEPYRLVMKIVDDGSGFDPGGMAVSDRYGLVGMRERAKKIKAELSIESQEGDGTVVTVSLPLDGVLKNDGK